jgi:diguanylate cyclase (GGDEF)-like protein/PAS domain S-box-containing protein
MEDRPSGGARRTLEVMTEGTADDVFETLVESAVVGLAAADLTGRLVRVNAAYARILGREPWDLVGESFEGLTHLDDADAERSRVDALLAGETETIRSELRLVAAGGRDTWVLHGVTLVRDAQGEPAWFALSAQDITERKRAEEEMRALSDELARRALHDSLTGLANRAKLLDRLRLAQARALRGGVRVGLLFCDLDDFKAVNDTHGHAVGDQVLVAVAQRLSSAVRPSDTVARLGGDEFVVLIDPAPEEETLDHLVRRLEEAVVQPVDLGALTVVPGVSIGRHLTSPRGEDGAPVPVEAILQGADTAMYAVKRQRRGRAPGQLTAPEAPRTVGPGSSTAPTAPGPVDGRGAGRPAVSGRSSP